MSRTDRRCLRSVCAMGVIAILGSGCSRDRTSDASGTSSASPAPSLEVIEARGTTMPEFREYMVGDPPSIASVTRDPFGSADRNSAPPATPSLGAAVNRGVPVLTGIVVSGGKRVAMFDLGSAAAGETVGGWRVIEIGERSALLEKNQGLLRVSL